MIAKRPAGVACIKRAAVAAMVFAAHFFAVHSAAQAQAPLLPSEMPAAAFVVLPEFTPVAAPATAPPLQPAVVAPRPLATSSGTAPPQSACRGPAELTYFAHPLIHAMRRLESGKPLTIVAIGSSSTAGAGASSPAATYPGRLVAELKARFPGRDITVFNRGVNGEETDDMMARFTTDVIAAHPQLILWQVGTNSVLRDHPLSPHAVELHKGIEELKATDADLVLIDPQYAPKVLAKSEAPGMVEQIALEAKEANVDLFRRFEVMRNWHEVQHLGFDVFLSPDRLHMNDWGYGCWAKLIAEAIADAATRPIAAAAARPTH